MKNPIIDLIFMSLILITFWAICVVLNAKILQIETTLSDISAQLNTIQLQTSADYHAIDPIKVKRPNGRLIQKDNG